jgi:hypothetical protein
LRVNRWSHEVEHERWIQPLRAEQRPTCRLSTDSDWGLHSTLGARGAFPQARADTANDRTTRAKWCETRGKVAGSASCARWCYSPAFDIARCAPIGRELSAFAGFARNACVSRAARDSPAGRPDCRLVREMYGQQAVSVRCAGGVRVQLAVSRSVIHLTRLETRTKESNICASSWVVNLRAQ